MSESSPSSDAQRPSDQPLLRVSLFFKRRPDISEKQFNDHWSNIHAPLTKEWLVRHGVVKYTQYHAPPSLHSSTLESFPELKGAGAQPLPYDGVVEIVVRRIEDFANARQDPFYKEHVIADEEKMVDRASARWMVGWEEVKIDVERREEDGKMAEKLRGEREG